MTIIETLSDEEAYERACKELREESVFNFSEKFHLELSEIYLCPFCLTEHSAMSDCSKDDLHNLYK